MNMQIKVRVQARGGKFLGPAVQAPHLAVREAISGNLLFQDTFDNSASGTVVATPSPTASRNAIVVQTPPTAQDYPGAGAYSLQPPAEGASLIATFDLSEPMLVSFIVTAFTKAGDKLINAATMQLAPNTTLLDDPGLLITIPGLLVSAATATYDGTTVTVQATVTMMCGCPITPQPWSANPPTTLPYWPSYEFNVTAYIAGMASIPLQCTANDTFKGSAAMALQPGSTYNVTVVALQPAETNSGYCTATLTT